MALKHGSSATLGLGELMDIVAAFEQQNTVRVELRSELTKWNGARDMVWTASAFPLSPTVAGVKPLAYANVRCLEKRLVTMEAVLLQLLYALDFQLAEKELGGSGTLRA